MPSLKLRWKILLAMIGLSVIPLAVSFLIVSGLSERQLERDQQARMELVTGLIERNTRFAEREKTNYIRLLADNTHTGSLLHMAEVLQTTVQLERSFSNISYLFNFDFFEILDRDGNPLLQQTDAARLREHPVVKSSMDGYFDSSLTLYDGRLSLVTAAPVFYQGDLIGHLMGVTLIDEQFLTLTFGADLASLKMELGFYGPQGVVAATREGLHELDVAAVVSGRTREIEVNGTSYAVFGNPLAVEAHGTLLLLDRSDLVSARQNFRRLLVLILASAFGLAVIVGLAISRSITNPLDKVVQNLREIADGEGDLTRTLAVRSRDEVGDLAESFNRFLARLREMVRRTRAVSKDLGDAADKIQLSSREVNEGAVRQSRSLEESLQALQGIEESVSGIAGSTGSLVNAAEESSSATLELGATIEEIAHQMEKLFATVDEVSSSIGEMSAAGQQIAENVEILSSSTEVTASSITELDSSIKEIEENAEKTNQLSEEAARDALKGKEAVESTIEGISSIRDYVDKAGKVVHDLGNQSNAIGKILTVIDEVADQTSLLALNAAIIAAQAGENGRSFAVVADEIRGLADRTAASTREIATIINRLQAGTREAVSAMNAGIERVHQEVARSQTAGAALEKIRISTTKSSEQMRGIVRATQEQSRGSRQITSSINQVASMLGQIAASIRQQTEGNRQLSRAAEAMKEIASQGKLSTGEQAKGSRQINASMEQIRTMIERIDEATRAQTARCRQVVEAVSQIRSIAEGTVLRTGQLDQVVDILSKQTDALENEVGTFKA
jgi:methyl-accepting chemotaxis protein